MRLLRPSTSTVLDSPPACFCCILTKCWFCLGTGLPPNLWELCEPTHLARAFLLQEAVRARRLPLRRAAVDGLGAAAQGPGTSLRLGARPSSRTSGTGPAASRGLRHGGGMAGARRTCPASRTWGTGSKHYAGDVSLSLLLAEATLCPLTPKRGLHCPGGGHRQKALA